MQIDKRLRVNPDLCFICQESEPTHEVSRTHGNFKVCASCLDLLQRESRTRNRVVRALHQNDRLGIFQKTLGLSTVPDEIKSKEIK